VPGPQVAAREGGEGGGQQQEGERGGAAAGRGKGEGVRKQRAVVRQRGGWEWVGGWVGLVWPSRTATQSMVRPIRPALGRVIQALDGRVVRAFSCLSFVKIRTALKSLNRRVNLQSGL
jgi:hypothetical protein